MCAHENMHTHMTSFVLVVTPRIAKFNIRQIQRVLMDKVPTLQSSRNCRSLSVYLVESGNVFEQNMVTSV